MKVRERRSWSNLRYHLELYLGDRAEQYNLDGILHDTAAELGLRSEYPIIEIDRIISRHRY